jgi:hypothetical protein
MNKISLLVLATAFARDNSTFTYKALSDMTSFFEPHVNRTNFDPVYFKKLENCLNQNDTELLASQNAAWRGMYDYFLSNGTDNDAFGKKDHWN